MILGQTRNINKYIIEMGACCTCKLIDDQWIQQCLQQSEHNQVKNLDMTQYKHGISWDKKNQYRVISVKVKQQNLYILYQPGQFYYQGMAIVDNSSNFNLDDKIIIDALGKGIIYWPQQQKTQLINPENQDSSITKYSQKNKGYAKNISYKGYFQNNKRKGKGIYDNGYGLKFQGIWADNIPVTGKLTMKDITAQIKYLQFAQISSSVFGKEQSYKNGKIKIDFGNNCYTGDFLWNTEQKKYCFHGNGKLEIKNKKEEYDGQWKNGKFHGKGIYTWSDNKYKFDGIYVNGIKQGKGKLEYKKNKYIEGQWKNNKKQGKFQIITFLPLSQVYDNEGQITYSNDQIIDSSI